MTGALWNLAQQITFGPEPGFTSQIPVDGDIHSSEIVLFLLLPGVITAECYRNAIVIGLPSPKEELAFWEEGGLGVGQEGRRFYRDDTFCGNSFRQKRNRSQKLVESTPALLVVNQECSKHILIQHVGVAAADDGRASDLAPAILVKADVVEQGHGVIRLEGPAVDIALCGIEGMPAEVFSPSLVQPVDQCLPCRKLGYVAAFLEQQMATCEGVRKML